MRKHKSAYLEPYVRKITKKDRNSTNCDFFTAIRLVLPSSRYVLVQRGTSRILVVAHSKEDFKKMTFNKTNRKFNQWRNKIKHFANCEY